MVNYVCIGKGTTDENGVAHITHDCNGNPLTSEPGYKGSGAGETLIVASLDKPVVSESVLSNVLSVSDVDNYSLLLSADKSIIQSSETSVLSATLKNNNIPLAGKTVEFTSEKVLKTLVGNGQTGSYGYLDDDYYLTVDDNCNYVAMGSSTGNWLKITPSTILLNGSSPSYSYDNDYPIHVKNGILTYVDGNGDSQTVDVSNYNPLKALLFNSGCTFRWYSLYGVTDSTGVASVPYVGTGAGLQSVTAKYGTIVSEPYPVIDATWYDDGVTNPKTKTWYNQNTAYSLTPSSDGTLVEISDTVQRKLFADGTTFSNSYKWTAPLCVEVTIVSNSGDNYFIIGGNVSPTMSVAVGTLKMVWDGSKVTKYVDGVQTGVTNNVTDSSVVIGFNCTSGSFKFKDFVIYPI